MPEPSWVRVHLSGVGTWSQREDAQMPEGAVVLDGEPALDPAGRAIPDVPEAPADVAPAAVEEQPSTAAADASTDDAAPDSAAGTRRR